MKLRIRKMPRPLDLRMFSGRERIREFLGIESFALVLDADDELLGIVRRNGAELDDDALGFVVLVAVLDRVDDRFADRHAHPVERIIVETGHSSDVIADHLDEIQHVERTAELDANGVRMGH